MGNFSETVAKDRSINEKGIYCCPPKGDLQTTEKGEEIYHSNH